MHLGSNALSHAECGVIKEATESVEGTQDDLEHICFLEQRAKACHALADLL